MVKKLQIFYGKKNSPGKSMPYILLTRGSGEKKPRGGNEVKRM
jgi:hypothetical protein